MNAKLIPDQQQNTLELLKTAFRIFKTTFFKTFPFLFLMSVIGLYMITYTKGLIHFPSSYNTLTTRIILLLLNLYIFYVFTAAGVCRMQALIQKNDPGFIKSLLFGFKKAPLLLIIGILYILAVTTGMFILVIPGVIIAVYFMFSFFLCVSGYGIFEAIKESFYLIRNHWWFTLLNILVIFLVNYLLLMGAIFLTMIAALVIEILFQTTLGRERLAFMAMIASCIMLIFISVYTMAFLLSAYYDLQLRQSQEKNK